MCYSIPGKVVSKSGTIATIDYFGERKTAADISGMCNIGNYAYAQGGVVVDVIPEEEAKRVLVGWKDKFIRLYHSDEVQSTAGISHSSPLDTILSKYSEGKSLTQKDISNLFGISKDSDLNSLYSFANKIRHDTLKNACCVHGIIEFSNYCRMICHYCGIRAENKKIIRYRMTKDEIVDCAVRAVRELGFRALVLQSGEDSYYTTEMLCEIVSEIKKQCGVLLFLSIGERPLEDYKRLYNAGAYGCLMRFETSNKVIYEQVRPGRKLSDRISLIKSLIHHGYVVATGFLIGLPGETTQDIINNILLTRSLKPEMYSFGPLIPHQETPLASIAKSAGVPHVSTELALKTIAISRILDPQAKILVTSALETLDRNKDAKRRGLMAGANSLMINLTPEQYREKYEIYPNRSGAGIKIKKNITETLSLLQDLGRAPTDLSMRNVD